MPSSAMPSDMIDCGVGISTTDSSTRPARRMSCSFHACSVWCPGYVSWATSSTTTSGIIGISVLTSTRLFSSPR